MAKLTFDEAIERLNEQSYTKVSDVLASALNRVVWVTEWHLPGCLSESQTFCVSKEEAINSACFMACDGYGRTPRGMKTSLRKYGRFNSHSEIYGTCINTVSKMRLSDLL